MRTLALRKETLAELTSDDLATVHGGSLHLTMICAALTEKVVDTVRDVLTPLSISCVTY